MPTRLPDCPHCSSAETLEAVASEPRGVRVCECSCCCLRCRVNVDGAVVHVPDVRDVNGIEMTGP